MRRIAAGVAMTMLALAPVAGAAEEEIPGWCRYTLLDVPDTAPRFEDYPAAKVAIAHPPPVDVSGKDAREFRTRLREAAKRGADFAGHYTIASWGCGTGCLGWAVIDQKTGKVTFADGMTILDNFHVDFERDDAVEARAKVLRATYNFGVMLYRADSSLFIRMGAPNEDTARDGVAYYRWTGTAFVPLKFYPAAQFCPKPKG
jgi:hypothetical protein